MSRIILWSFFQAGYSSFSKQASILSNHNNVALWNTIQLYLFYLIFSISERRFFISNEHFSALAESSPCLNPGRPNMAKNVQPLSNMKTLFSSPKNYKAYTKRKKSPSVVIPTKWSGVYFSKPYLDWIQEDQIHLANNNSYMSCPK